MVVGVMVGRVEGEAENLWLGAWVEDCAKPAGKE
jgi:hypothetical protein